MPMLSRYGGSACESTVRQGWVDSTAGRKGDGSLLQTLQWRGGMGRSVEGDCCVYSWKGALAGTEFPITEAIHSDRALSFSRQMMCWRVECTRLFRRSSSVITSSSEQRLVLAWTDAGLPKPWIAFSEHSCCNVAAVVGINANCIPLLSEETPRWAGEAWCPPVHILQALIITCMHTRIMCLQEERDVHGLVVRPTATTCTQ